MDTTKAISFAQAFSHCTSTSSYWISMLVVVAILGAGWLLIWKKLSKTEDTTTVATIWLAVTVLALAAAILGRPAEVAANTSTEMAAHGHYLGY